MPGYNITFESKGDFSKGTKYLKELKQKSRLQKLDKYGRMGVDALKEATPKDTGLTAKSWTYETKMTGNKCTLEWKNTNVNNGVSIALIIDMGHATGTGGWVEGRHYIDPALQPIFNKICEEAWKEVTSV